MNKKLFMAVEEKKECDNLCGSPRGCSNPATEDHTCPFSEEIHNDYEYMCNCCDDCYHECAMDI
jgi:hypothetical protein